ncbi:response regulator [Priestia aryabhattai]|nr:response regulator [Priestia aryabhattai]
MASSLSLDERALILAPRQLATHTSTFLTSAGIDCVCSRDITHLRDGLDRGAGLLVVDEHTLNSSQNELLQAFIDQQPPWSDLPIVLLTQTPQASASPCTPADHPLGNLTLLAIPFEDEQLLELIKLALRQRRRQYLARDQLVDLQQRLDGHSEAQHSTEQAMHQARKMDAIGQLAGGVAHDFNNLLTSIGGSFELIDRRLKQGSTKGLEGLLSRGQEAVSRAARLTHRLLAFSSRQSLHSRRIDLRALLQPQRLEAVLQHGVLLQLQIPEHTWPVAGDDTQLQEAVDNLLLNACEAMPNGGKVRVEASNREVAATQFADGSLAVGDYTCLSVTDEGQGMSQSTLEHAFEPFFSTKPVGQGIGLGLSMVYGFSKQSQGHVVLHSQIGQGTRVDLYLPRHLEQEQPQVQAAPPRSQGGGRTVLVVEDDPDVRQLLCQTLQEQGFPCCSACNASEALQVLRSSKAIDLLVSDVGLPGMNGRQLAEIARTLHPHLPILFITGYTETAMAREGFLGAGMQLMCKPFELAQFHARVMQILGET